MILSLAPYVPTNTMVVQRMLEIAQTNRDDVVFDLGCGDGRILFSAVKDFGAKKSIGYELRRDLHRNVLQKIQKERLENRIQVFNDNLLNADISEATVITLYLTTSGNSKLKPKFETEAKAGTKIISHDFSIDGWAYTKRERFNGHTIYLYTIPESLKKEKTKHTYKSWWRRI